MLRKPLLWIGICVVPCWQVPAAASEPKTVDEVIANYIKAIGGRDKLDAVKSMKITGKMVLGGGMEAPLIVEVKRPNKVRVEFTFQGMTAVRAFDGETGWFTMPFIGKTDPEKMPPDQLKLMEDQADFDGPLVDYKKKGHKVELLGKDEAEGSEAYKLKVTKKNGDIEYHYLEAEYFLPIQVKGKWELQGSQIEYEVVPGDYKAVNGVLFAHSIEQRMGAMGGTTMTFEKVKFNVKLDDDRFAMPEVKKAEPTVEKKEQKEEKKGEVKKDKDSSK